jgi:hypothetical protein
MMLSAATTKSTRGRRKASTYSIPAPVGGWNVLDPLAGMKERDAIVLENWFPKASDVVLRPGAENWATGAPTDVQTLLTWNGLASQKMFAATATGIRDATTAGVMGASLSTLTNGYLISTDFNVLGGAYLIAVNGVDKLKLYNGTVWADIDAASVPAITGVVTTDLDYVAVLKRRLWFVRKNTMSAWYLPVAQIGGALVEFPMGQVFTKGGRLVAIGSWTIDGGAGSDDYGVFISSEGEVAVYQGSDPSSAADWNLVGVYYIGEPLGKNCFCKYGGDLLILTRNGLFPLSRALQEASINKSKALSTKIDTALIDAANQYGDNLGWSVTVFPQGGFLLVNVPIAVNYVQQYVMNTTTGAWCKFLGWNAHSWTVFNKKLYFAKGGDVAQAWKGLSDFGNLITGKAQQAYNDFRRPAQQKHYKLIRPILTSNGSLGVSLSLDVDYALSQNPSVTTPAAVGAAVWDGSVWDGDSWAGDAETRREWASVFAREGYTAALRLQVATNAVSLSWSATDFVYEVGGIL